MSSVCLNICSLLSTRINSLIQQQNQRSPVKSNQLKVLITVLQKLICAQLVMKLHAFYDKVPVACLQKSSLVLITGCINPAHAGIPLLPYNASEYSLPSTPTSPKLSLPFGSQTRFLKVSNRFTSLCWSIQLQSYLTIIQRTALIRDITQRRLVSPCRRFDTTQLFGKFHKPHVINVLCYKSEGRWFDPSWCQWIFH